MKGLKTGIERMVKGVPSSIYKVVVIYDRSLQNVGKRVKRVLKMFKRDAQNGEELGFEGV